MSCLLVLTSADQEGGERTQNYLMFAFLSHVSELITTYVRTQLLTELPASAIEVAHFPSLSFAIIPTVVRLELGFYIISLVLCCLDAYYFDRATRLRHAHNPVYLLRMPLTFISVIPLFTYAGVVRPIAAYIALLMFVRLCYTYQRLNVPHQEDAECWVVISFGLVFLALECFVLNMVYRVVFIVVQLWRLHVWAKRQLSDQADVRPGTRHVLLLLARWSSPQ